MKKKASIIGVVIIVIFAFIFLLPVNASNVIFSRCMNSNELATVFQETSFKTHQSYAVDSNGATLLATSNSQLFGTPLKGSEMDSVLAAEPQNAGVIILDGNISMLDMIRIKKSPFVDDVTIYLTILDGGDRDVLSSSSTRFFDKHPEARYWTS